MPTVPVNEAGWRIEPPVSLPRAQGTSLAATAAALPPDEPPGVRVVSQGLSAGPKALFSVDEPIANSSMFVLPITTASAARRRSMTAASYGGTYPARIFEPAVDGMPRVQMASFTP